LHAANIVLRTTSGRERLMLDTILLLLVLWLVVLGGLWLLADPEVW
jgi:hypothetical protein